MIVASIQFFAALLATFDPVTLPPGDGPAWSPYVVGALIGLLSMATFYFSDHPLGASGAYATFAGLVSKWIAPRHTQRLKHFKDHPPKIDWEWMLVLGVVIGGFLAAWTGGESRSEWLPVMWEEHFGSDIALRFAVAIAGGGAMAFGARMAGGCTSGHGISGAFQLSVSSWIALSCFFIGGMTTAFAMFYL